MLWLEVNALALPPYLHQPYTPTHTSTHSHSSAPTYTATYLQTHSHTFHLHSTCPHSPHLHAHIPSYPCLYISLYVCNICIFVYIHMQANIYFYIFISCIFIWNIFLLSTLLKLWCLWTHLIYLVHFNFCENTMLILFISSKTWQAFKPIAINATHKLNAQILDTLICKMWIIMSWLWECHVAFKWSRTYIVDT